MAILVEENVKSILCELKKKVEESIGVMNAIRQGSVNFENWVQIEMCGILSRYIDSGNKIVIEKNGNFDIRICGKSEENKVAIEIKIIKSGHYEMSKIQDDVIKLDNFEQSNESMEKAVLCVVYKESQREKECKEILKEISEYIGNRSQISGENEFTVGDTEVVLYLNRWGCVHKDSTF